jgi:type IV pilus biogenesis protein CpaD/CtpE
MIARMHYADWMAQRAQLPTSSITLGEMHMKGMTLAAVAGAILLCGCASTDNPTTGQNTVASRGEAPLGSYIKKKSGTNDNTMLDKQALENERQMNNGSINLPTR